MQREQQVAVPGLQVANEGPAVPVEKLEYRIQSIRRNGRILLAQALFRSQAREQAIGVDFGALYRDVAILVVDEVGNPGMGRHVPVQHLARGIFVTMDMEVAATAVAGTADVEPHTREFHDIAMK